MGKGAPSQQEHRDNIVVCAPSFEDFIYRFWLENVLWFKLNGDDSPMTADERRYLAHYRPGAMLR